MSYTITSDIGTVFSWDRVAVAGITSNTGSGSVAAITETLTNSNVTSTNVTYVINSTGPAPGNCASVDEDLIVTIVLDNKRLF